MPSPVAFVRPPIGPALAAEFEMYDMPKYGELGFMLTPTPRGLLKLFNGFASSLMRVYVELAVSYATPLPALKTVPPLDVVNPDSVLSATIENVSEAAL